MKSSKRISLIASKHLYALIVAISMLIFIISPLEGNSYCHDRTGEPNTGFCTRDPDYHGGAYVCLLGGFTCDGDDIFNAFI
ncbi:MAG: hypothetical protein ACK4S0_07755 [Sediminibacterium sp.]